MRNAASLVGLNDKQPNQIMKDTQEYDPYLCPGYPGNGLRWSFQSRNHGSGLSNKLGTCGIVTGKKSLAVSIDITQLALYCGVAAGGRYCRIVHVQDSSEEIIKVRVRAGCGFRYISEVDGSRIEDTCHSQSYMLGMLYLNRSPP